MPIMHAEARKQLRRVKAGIYKDRFLDITIRNTKMLEKGASAVPPGRKELGDWEIDLAGEAKCYVSSYAEAKSVIMAMRKVLREKPIIYYPPTDDPA